MELGEASVRHTGMGTPTQRFLIVLSAIAAGLLLAVAILAVTGDRLVPCADVFGLDAWITDAPDGGAERAYCAVPTASAWGLAVVAGLAPLVAVGAYWAGEGEPRVAGALTAAAAVLILLVLLAWASFTGYQTDCADVGLSGPHGATTQGAFEAFMAEEGGDSANWAFRGSGYVPLTDDAEPSQYRTIGVRQLATGMWVVDGACV
jgi:hypothetical protein